MMVRTSLCHAYGVTFSSIPPVCAARRQPPFLKKGAVRIVILLWLLLLKNIAFAISFEATVDRIKINTNQSIHLKLQLEDAKAKGDPDLSELQKYFTIRGREKFTNVSYIMGKEKSTKTWQITIRPKMPGELIIPVISLKTNQGMQYTQAINVYVDVNEIDQANFPIKIEGVPEKTEVFVKEPFIYTVNIFYGAQTAKTILDKLTIPNCLVEEVLAPRNGKAIINGKSVQTTERKYLITPIKDENIEIPPILLRGEMQTSEIDRDMFLDPFGNMSMFGNLRQFHEYEPFTVQTKAVSIKVKPAIPDISPWLVLNDLQVKETWDGLENSKVGEPIIRTITLNAIGNAGKELPSLKPELEKIPNVKVYSDNPEFKYEIDPKTDKIIGMRKEQFSIISMKSGVIDIPEINIEWWDLNKNRKTITKIPAKQITVQENDLIGNNADKNNNNNGLHNENLHTKELNTQIKILYGIIIALVVIFAAVIIFILRYNRKEKKVINTDDKSYFSDINKINDLNALQEFVLDYAFEKWQLPKNLALKEVLVKLQENNYSFDQQLAIEFFTALDKALYSREQGSLVELKLLWEKFSKNVVSNINKRSKNNILDKLNPT